MPDEGQRFTMPHTTSSKRGSSAVWTHLRRTGSSLLSSKRSSGRFDADPGRRPTSTLTLTRTRTLTLTLTVSDPDPVPAPVNVPDADTSTSLCQYAGPARDLCYNPDPVFPQIGVLPGPNAAPDYFTDQDIATFYSSSYSVHYNSCAAVPVREFASAASAPVRHACQVSMFCMCTREFFIGDLFYLYLAGREANFALSKLTAIRI